MWNIVIHRYVLSEDFKGIDPHSRRIILKSIHKKLSQDPERYGSPLSGEYKGYWKLRVGDFRVVYRIVKDKVLVVVIKIGIRRDDRIYRELIHRLKKM
ncbi:MAG: type II toxin-antitoxin system RelE/ParE family toxin [Candidatus Omnitrophica bacterium]|nr:type II toxin-antitoxin system RelE/ParE family toxin [Candidatus Omnitrophota bacterium]